MVKEHHRFLTEWYKGSNNIRSLLGCGTKGQTTSDVSYGVVQRVKQHQMFVTEWYKGSNNTRGLLPSVAKGQTPSEVGYGVCTMGQTTSET